MEYVPRKQMDDRSKLIRSYHALYSSAKRQFMEMHAYDFYKAGLTVEEISEIMCVPQDSITHCIRKKQVESEGE